MNPEVGSSGEFGGHPSRSKSLSSRKRFESLPAGRWEGGLLPAVYSVSSLRLHATLRSRSPIPQFPPATDADVKCSRFGRGGAPPLRSGWPPPAPSASPAPLTLSSCGAKRRRACPERSRRDLASLLRRTPPAPAESQTTPGPNRKSKIPNQKSLHSAFRLSNRKSKIAK